MQHTADGPVRATSVPEGALVVVDRVLLEQCQQLRAKIGASVKLSLTLDVRNHDPIVTRSLRRPRIRPAREIGPSRVLLIEPVGRIGFDRPHEIGKRLARRQSDEDVNVILGGIDFDNFAFSPRTMPEIYRCSSLRTVSGISGAQFLVL